MGRAASHNGGLSARLTNMSTRSTLSTGPKRKPIARRTPGTAARDEPTGAAHEAALDRRFLELKRAQYPGRPSRRAMRVLVRTLRNLGFAWPEGRWTRQQAEACADVATEALALLERDLTAAEFVPAVLEVLDRCGHVGWMRLSIRLWRCVEGPLVGQGDHVAAALKARSQAGGADPEVLMARLSELTHDRMLQPWELPRRC